MAVETAACLTLKVSFYRQTALSSTPANLRQGQLFYLPIGPIILEAFYIHLFSLFNAFRLWVLDAGCWIPVLAGCL
jgi:hypothetical protein